MQVFIVGTAFETAQALDKARLNKQILECTQIINAINGNGAWSNHPCTLQYKEHIHYLIFYKSCLTFYREGLTSESFHASCMAENFKPEFHIPEYFDQMKRRLYTKNPVHYAQWAKLGTTEINWYYVDSEWRFYRNGKRIKENIIMP